MPYNWNTFIFSRAMQIFNSHRDSEKKETEMISEAGKEIYEELQRYAFMRCTKFPKLFLNCRTDARMNSLLQSLAGWSNEPEIDVLLAKIPNQEDPTEKEIREKAEKETKEKVEKETREKVEKEMRVKIEQEIREKIEKEIGEIKKKFVKEMELEFEDMMAKKSSKDEARQMMEELKKNCSGN